MAELVIEGLRAGVAGKEILKGIDLTVRSGEVHAIMGPNGSGKSTLSHVVMGRPGYEVLGGSVTLDGVDLLPLAPWERAQAGLFLASVRGQRTPEQFHLSAAQRQHARERAQQRALARAVGANDTHQFARAQVQVDPGRRVHPTTVLGGQPQGQGAHSEEWWGGGGRPRALVVPVGPRRHDPGQRVPDTAAAEEEPVSAAERVAQPGHGQRGGHQHPGRGGQRPPGPGEHVSARHFEEGSQAGLVGGEPQTEEAERGLEDDGPPQLQGRHDDHGTQDVGQHVAQHHDR